MLSDLFLFLNKVVFIKETIHIFIYFSHALLGLDYSATLWTVACQATLSMGFFR